MEPLSEKNDLKQRCAAIRVLAEQEKVPLSEEIVLCLARCPHEPDSFKIKRILAQLQTYAKLLDAELTMELAGGLFWEELWSQDMFGNIYNSESNMKDSPSEPKEYAPFFKRITEFKSRRQKEISEGKNDYNIITALLRQSDEVRLHSRFIYSLINPEGKHYQGSLFLKMFLDVIGIKDFNYSTAIVKRERENIDLYITDGTLHIIVENKIHAIDQEKQLDRYIKNIISNNISESLSTEELYAKIFVVYLTLDKRTPSDKSLVDWSICSDDQHIGSYLKYIGEGKYKDYELHYLNITYCNHIRKWLNKVLEGSKNLCNLPFSIESYQEVIGRLIKVKGSNLMTIEEHLLDDKNIDDLKLYLDIAKKSESVKGEILLKFFNNCKDSVTSAELNLCQQISSADHLKKLERYICNKTKCKKWFETGISKEHYIGTYFGIDDNIQFGIMAASKNLHAVLICDENIYNKLCAENLNVDKNYQKRDWKKQKAFAYYSKDLKHNIFDNIAAPTVITRLLDKNSKEFKEILCELLSLAEIVIEFNNSCCPD
ncbi:MAG: PD-(D/E)XK nuclease family protein [Verrucomicrobia bacterium]|nr:PD-(D/E)XK nuclease family protein [Deltaproteobacteria bacterium]